MYDVVSLGELLIDFASDGTADGYPVFSAHPGGAPANYLAALAEFGAKAAMIAKVGDDAFGSMLIDTLVSKNIETRYIVKDKNAFTTLAFVTFTPERDRVFSFARKPGADMMLRKSDIDESAFSNARVFHFGTLSLTDEPARGATFYAIEKAKAHGALISFDPNYRAPLWQNREDAIEMMKAGLKAADIVKISREEVDLLFGDISDEEASRIIREKYKVRLLYITKGNKGCYYETSGIKGSMGIYDLGKPLDTTGAGDIFGGSATYAFLRKNKSIEELDERDLQDIVAFATVASGISTMKMGGISSVPALEEVLKALSKFEK